jgi:hypothetical protein
MGKYLKYEQKSQKKNKEMNPVWRGIGCILILLVPAMSYGLMLVFVPPIIATGMIPWELLGYVHFPVGLLSWPVLGPLLLFIGSINNLWINLIGFFVFLVVLSGTFSLLYSLVWQYAGPPRYTLLDVPPSDHKGKSYKR